MGCTTCGGNKNSTNANSNSSSAPAEDVTTFVDMGDGTGFLFKPNKKEQIQETVSNLPNNS